MTDAGHEYLHPGYKKPYPIETVLRDLAAQEGCDGEPYDAMVFAAETITTLRAQLAEARAELVRRVDMHECAMAERDDATLYSDEQRARADRAEAALAAQIEVDAAICTDIIGYDCMKADGETYQPMWVQKVAKGMVSLARQDIRNQPHDRTALDRYREKVLREAADSVQLGDTVQSIQRRILALIEHPK